MAQLAILPYVVTICVALIATQTAADPGALNGTVHVHTGRFYGAILNVALSYIAEVKGRWAVVDSSHGLPCHGCKLVDMIACMIQSHTPGILDHGPLVLQRAHKSEMSPAKGVMVTL